ncbi:hypothetical protein Neosp_008981 [[Neocosmospora] mangrovei]
MSTPSDTRRDRTSEECDGPDLQCDRMLERLDRFLESFLQVRCSRDAFYGRFAHIDLPPYRLDNLMVHMHESLAKVQTKARLFFIVSDVEYAMVPPNLDMQAVGLSPEILTFADLLAILRANWRGYRGSRPLWHGAHQPRGWERYHILPTNAIFIMQIDCLLPAECALCLIGLVHWAIATAIHPAHIVRIVTMSADRGCDILSKLVEIQEPTSTVDHLDLSDFGDDPAGDAIVCRTTEECMASDALRLFSEHVDEPQVVLSFVDSGIQDHFDNLRHASDQVSLDIHRLKTDYDVEDLRAIQRCDETDPRSHLVFVDIESPILPIAFEGYACVHIILNPRHPGRLVWDDDATQLVESSEDCSIEERTRQIWWARQPDVKRVYIHTVETDVHSFLNVQHHTDRKIEGVQLGGFIAALFQPWFWDIDAGSMLPAFVRYPLRIAFMLRQLEGQRILLGQNFALEGTQAAIFWAALPVCEYDHRPALLVSLDCDREVRRVRVQQVALLLGDINRLLELKSSCPFAYHDQRSRVLRMCWGYGRSLAKGGTIWLALGLWKFFLKLRMNDQQAQQGREALQILQLNERAYGAVERKVVELTAALDQSEALSSEDMDELIRPIDTEYHELDDTQLQELQGGLAQAFMYQATRGFQADDVDIDDTTVSHEVLVTVTALPEIKQPTKLVTLVDIHRLFTQEGSETVYGICKDLKRVDGEIVAPDWTWIPSSVFLEWMD